MNAADAAREVRKAIKQQGINPRGMVSLHSTDYTTEVSVCLRGVYGENLEAIEDLIDSLPYQTNFSWHVWS